MTLGFLTTRMILGLTGDGVKLGTGRVSLLRLQTIYILFFLIIDRLMLLHLFLTHNHFISLALSYERRNGNGSSRGRGWG